MATDRPFAFTQQDFEFLASLVYDKTGIVLAGHKRNMVYSRLSRRLRELKLETFRAYIDYVSGPAQGEEIGHLVNAITTNLTSFFREAHHFEHLREKVLEPLLSGTRGDRRLRIWSAGCSSGAEPYSIAMVLAACLEKHSGWDAKILATDIDTNMLDRGSAGRYRIQDFNSIPQPYRKYCEQMKRAGEEGIIMKPAIRKLVHFRRLNLLEKWPVKGPFDIIFCRNVVIYFDKKTQTELFARYRRVIRDDGYLYIGHSENLFKVSDKFKLEGKTIYRPA